MNQELSPYTGKPMILVMEQDSAEYRGEKYRYTHLAYRCVDSGEQFTTDKLDEINQNQVFNAYRERHAFPFPSEIIQLREHYGVSASMMSEIMGFGANQWRFYEAGKVPNESNARAITAIRNKSVFIDFLDAARNAIGDKAFRKIKDRLATLPEFHRPAQPSIENGYISFSSKKAAESIKFFCSRLGGVFVTKMNKLLFYSDFVKYKREGRGLTGLKYMAIKHGPVPKDYGELYSRAEDIDMEEYIYPNGTSGIILVTNKEPELSAFTQSELKILEDVCEYFRNYSAGKISEQSHREKGWIECSKDKSIIPYSFAFEINL